MSSTSLNARRRARELDALAGETVDVLVIGGGIVGAGVALDAASRGLSVALVERGDLAQGTSRWSSKLIHGGLRYLASGDVGVAYESAVERGILMRHTAPHLVRALPSVIPTASRAQAAKVWAGLQAGDALRMAAGTPSALLPRPRRLTVDELVRYAPGVDPGRIRGGLLAWDGQSVDDARLVVAVARTAAGLGARIITRCAAVSVHGGGARLRDELPSGGEVPGIGRGQRPGGGGPPGEMASDGQRPGGGSGGRRGGPRVAGGGSVPGDAGAGGPREFDVTARVVVNATGVWADQLAPGVSLRPSRGSHVIVPAARLGGLTCGITVQIPGGRNRFGFALPAGDGRAYLGITDEPVDDVPDGDPVPSDAEIAALLGTFDEVLRTPLRRDDVIGSFAGLRPLLDAGPADTADLSRRHVVRVDGGVVTVVGGKFTTYRRMAEDAVDRAVASAGLRARPCVTARLPLVGAASHRRLAQVAAPARIVARYGMEATKVIGNDDRPITKGCAVTGAEFAFALRHEGALDAADLLDRRTRIGLVPADRAAALPAAEQAVSQFSLE